jgi:(2Fe-2S) ferredoxin
MHIFICDNKRHPPQASCGKRRDTAHFAAYLKKKIDENEALSGDDNVKVLKTKCLGRCQLGPVLTVFPEKVWYSYSDEGDIDEIISDHLVAGCVVERLTFGAKPVALRPS